MYILFHQTELMHKQIMVSFLNSTNLDGTRVTDLLEELVVGICMERLKKTIRHITNAIKMFIEGWQTYLLRRHKNSDFYFPLQSIKVHACIHKNIKSIKKANGPEFVKPQLLLRTKWRIYGSTFPFVLSAWCLPGKHIKYNA